MSARNIPKVSGLRLLVLTPAHSTRSAVEQSQPSPFPEFLTKLSGCQPSEHITLYTGYTSHNPLSLNTKYYEVDVNLWCDELPSSTKSDQTIPVKQSEDSTTDSGTGTTAITTLSDWQEQMLSVEASEVRQVIGGIILLLPLISAAFSSTHGQERQISAWLPFIEAVSTLRDAIEDETGREVGSIILLQEAKSTNPQKTSRSNHDTSAVLLEKLEDECLSSRGILGWNFVSWKSELNPITEAINTQDDLAPQQMPDLKNQFGEKVGFPRVLEVLEGIDWFAPLKDDEEDFDELELEDNPQSLDVLSDTGPSRSLTNDQEFQQEIMGLKMAMLGPETAQERDDQPSQLEVSTPETIKVRTKHDDVWSSLDNRDPTGEDGLDIQVDQLQALMERAIAVRDAASDLPAAEREKFARREVGKMMRELG